MMKGTPETVVVSETSNKDMKWLYFHMPTKIRLYKSHYIKLQQTPRISSLHLMFLSLFVWLMVSQLIASVFLSNVFY